MKICNSCMQMTGDTSERCPVCKMSDFTALDSSDAVRERQVKKLKQSKGVFKAPQRNIRRVRYSNSLRGRGSLARSIASFVFGSAVLSVILHSTVWSSPGNPLDVRNWPSLFDESVEQIGFGFVDKGLPIVGWGENTSSVYDLALSNAHYSVNQEMDFTEANKTKEVATLILRFNVKNVSNALAYPTISRGELFDSEDWGYESRDSYQVDGDFVKCPEEEEVDIGVGWSFWVTPGETYHFTQCFLVESLSDFTFISSGREVAIPKELIQIEKPKLQVVNEPNQSLPRAGEKQTLGNLTVKLNEISRGREPFDYVQFDVTVTNNGTAPLSLPILNGVSSSGKRFNISSGEDLPGDKGAPSLFFGQLEPGMSHRYKSSIELPINQDLELRFLTLWYEQQPSQPTSWIGFFIPAAD